MKTYFALTLGPIYKTLAMARKTRELWVTSYFFSYLMEQMISVVESEGDIVLPVKHGITNNKAGLYPDRLILELKQNKSRYFEIKIKIQNEFKNIIDSLSGTQSYEKKSFFIDYFQLYMLEINLSDKEDPIQTIIPLLDSMEQKASFVLDYETNYLYEFLEKINEWSVYKEIFKDQKRFPSVLEIATQDLKNIENPNVPKLIKNYKPNDVVFDRIFDFCLENEGKTINEKLVKDTLAIALLKEAYNPKGSNDKDDERFRFYHKYMAVVQADGDNLSKVLHALHTFGDIKAVQVFSKILIEFGYEATTLIQKFGGTPIYMGGDDLLFFAPVIYNGKTIFHLLNEIDELFKSKVLSNEIVAGYISGWNGSATVENKRKKIELSLSFGMTISYHKYPLKESIETTRKLLFEVSKEVPGKNATSFKLLKNSGQYFNATFKNDWKSFYPLLFELTVREENDMNFLTSVQHKLSPLRSALCRILVGREVILGKASFKQDVERFIPNEADREFLLMNLMNNFFNEFVHKEDPTKEFLLLVFKWLLLIYREMEDIYGNNTQTAEKAIDTLYAILRFIQFIKQPDTNEEED